MPAATSSESLTHLRLSVDNLRNFNKTLHFDGISVGPTIRMGCHLTTTRMHDDWAKADIVLRRAYPDCSLLHANLFTI